MSQRTVAIVGASADRSKYSNKAIRAHIQRGWIVYPVNPKGESIEGLRTYASLDDVPRPLDRVSIYLPPQTGVSALDAIARANAKEFYVNPGAESDEFVERARSLGLDPILACSIVAIGERPGSYA